MMRLAASQYLIPHAQVGIVMQLKGAMTEFGEFRATPKGVAPAHPTRIQSVRRSHQIHGAWPLADGASRENLKEI